jgi:hypothetical protein
LREEVTMTTQQVPQTPPLWRRVLSLPHSRLGKWAIGLAAGSVPLFLWLLLIVQGPFSDPHTWVPPWLSWAVTALAVILAIMVLVVPLASGVVGSLALGAGERSLLVWFAQVPAVLFFLLLVTAFEQDGPWVRGPVSVLVWAVIAFSLILSKRGGA